MEKTGHGFKIKLEIEITVDELRGEQTDDTGNIKYNFDVSSDIQTRIIESGFFQPNGEESEPMFRRTLSSANVYVKSNIENTIAKMLETLIHDERQIVEATKANRETLIKKLVAKFQSDLRERITRSRKRFQPKFVEGLFGDVDGVEFEKRRARFIKNFDTAYLEVSERFENPTRIDVAVEMFPDKDDSDDKLKEEMRKFGYTFKYLSGLYKDTNKGKRKRKPR